mmetsp:Transcript_8964/g.29681  ORF Transcript_8964/g.29681 Transcript_8964/m.29681 type:complete len:347 (-) Transcript_8964:620-1660(-)
MPRGGSPSQDRRGRWRRSARGLGALAALPARAKRRGSACRRRRGQPVCGARAGRERGGGRTGQRGQPLARGTGGRGGSGRHSPHRQPSHDGIFHCAGGDRRHADEPCSWLAPDARGHRRYGRPAAPAHPDQLRLARSARAGRRGARQAHLQAPRQPRRRGAGAGAAAALGPAQLGLRRQAAPVQNRREERQRQGRRQGSGEGGGSCRQARGCGLPRRTRRGRRNAAGGAGCRGRAHGCGRDARRGSDQACGNAAARSAGAVLRRRGRRRQEVSPARAASVLARRSTSGPTSEHRGRRDQRGGWSRPVVLHHADATASTEGDGGYPHIDLIVQTICSVQIRIKSSSL